MHKNKIIGYNGEQKAEEFLIKKGYRIITKNFFSKYGEIDIIAQKKDTICFIEVKNYSKKNIIDIHYSIPKSKQQKIIKTAKYYIAKNNIIDKDLRFDAIFIIKEEIEHIAGAFFT